MTSTDRGASFAWALVVAGVALVAAANQAWWTVPGDRPTDVTGVQATGGLAQALGLIVLAGMLLALTLGTRGRRAVGALLALTQASAVALAFGGPGDFVTMAAEPLPQTATITPAAAWWGYLIAALVGTVAATGYAWRPPQARARVREVADSPATWKAMDDGVDPTLDDDRPRTDKEQP